MSFTPNMSKEQIMKQDMKRGDQKEDPLDTYPSSDHPKEKKPWLQKVAVYKGDNMSGSDILKSYLKNKDVMSYGEDKKEDVEGLFDEAAKSSLCMDDGLEELKKNDDEEEDSIEVEVEVSKALSSSNFPVLRPQGQYDPFGIFRSATTATTRNFSKLAPAVKETLDDVVENENMRTAKVTYKSCGSHGLPYREDSGCNMCKSSGLNMCKGCGASMEKTIGGYTCKGCE